MKNLMIILSLLATGCSTFRDTVQTNKGELVGGDRVHFTYQRSGKAMSSSFDEHFALTSATIICQRVGFTSAKFLEEIEGKLSKRAQHENNLSSLYGNGVGTAGLWSLTYPTRHVFYQCVK